ncbi:MAG: branched-chain amino acid transport system permease protein [Gaiellales bacterium]|nr:branched-chain amino acid transport system permease protein [Gaiellales bacterium]
MKSTQTVERVIGAIGVAIFVLAPLLFSVYTVDQLMTLMLIYAIVAMSLVFLASYGGMVSLAQTALFGIAGFVFGNMTTVETKGLALGYSPWWGIVPALVIATGIGLLYGALASRSTGIYFLMITLTYGVIAYLTFSQIENISGFGGVSGIVPPDTIGTTDAHPHRLYYLVLVLAVLLYALIRYLIRTPFGIALQGVRDEPVRMSSLGYSVALHRTLAFGVGAFVAATAGLLFVWWNGHVDPQTINVGATINILIIAVIGGLRRLEGAFVGAIAFVFINDRLAATDFSLGGYKLGTFNSLIGLIFLAIVLLSPDGLLGIWDRGTGLLKRRPTAPVPAGD